MSIPDYQTILLPLLQWLGDGTARKLPDARDYIAGFYKLTPEERTKELPSGKQRTYISNRTGWARTYLKQAGLVESPQRGYFKISERGRQLLSDKPKSISVKMLEQYPEFIEFRQCRKNNKDKDESTDSVEFDSSTPDEVLENAYSRLTRQLEADVLEQVKLVSPYFFEKAVVELLLKMGYGGSREDAGQAVGKSGDGGIDGIINEDRLGLDAIYIQAKHWEGTVGRPEIQKFVGALQGQRTRKGIFITTSNFSNEAIDFVNQIETKIVLIDGQTVSRLMVEYNLGVATEDVYELKKIDMDFFTDEV